MASMQSRAKSRVSAAAAEGKEDPEEEWLAQCKATTRDSDAWRQLMEKVTKETKDELSKLHLIHFSKLTHDEKSEVISKVEVTLRGTPELKQLLELVRHSVDVGLSRAVSSEMAEGKHRIGMTKVDVLMKKASDSACRLLKGWPRNEQHLRLMLNRPLAGPLRPPAWGLLLNRKDARGQYDTTLAKHPSSTISGSDTLILNLCQRLLVSDFGSVASSSRLVVTVMKTVVSYCHVISAHDDFLVYGSDLLRLLVPLLATFHEAVSAGAAGELIEHYIALVAIVQPEVFIKPGHEYPAPTEAPPHSQMRALLLKYDPQLLQTLATGVQPADIPQLPEPQNEWFRNSGAAAPEVAADSTGLVEHMELVMLAVRRNLFILASANCTTSLEVINFVYDQCLLSRFMLLPTLCAAVVTLSREQLMLSNSQKGITMALENCLSALTVTALQRELEFRYAEELRDVNMPSWEPRLATSIEGSPLLFHDDIAEPPVATPPAASPSPAPVAAAVKPPTPKVADAKPTPRKGKRGAGLAPAAAEEAEPAAAAEQPTGGSAGGSMGAALLMNKMLNFKRSCDKGLKVLDPLLQGAPAEGEQAAASASAAEGEQAAASAAESEQAAASAAEPAAAAEGEA